MRFRLACRRQSACGIHSGAEGKDARSPHASVGRVPPPPQPGERLCGALRASWPRRLRIRAGDEAPGGQERPVRPNSERSGARESPGAPPRSVEVMLGRGTRFEVACRHRPTGSWWIAAARPPRSSTRRTSKRPAVRDVLDLTVLDVESEATATRPSFRSRPAARHADASAARAWCARRLSAATEDGTHGSPSFTSKGGGRPRGSGPARVIRAALDHCGRGWRPSLAHCATE